ncbi:MAG TPA: GAF domain-containing protein [Phototrophicaceae bacterium]|nr:GAF domain-containing protein [Phototrophicaceae bacterium]
MKNNKRRTPQLRRRQKNHLESRWDTTLATIIEVSRILSSNLDIDTIWDALHDHINLLFDASSFFIALYDYERDRLTLPLVSEDGLRVEHDPIPVVGMSRAVMMHGVEFYVHDAEAERERLLALGIEPDEREPGGFARSWIGVPLRSRQSEVNGLIALQNVIPNGFDDHDLSLLMAIAAPLSLSLDNLRLAETERERRMIAAALMEIGQLAGVNLDYDDVLERILDQLQRVVSYDSAAILLTPTEGERSLMVGASHDPEAFDKGASLHYSEIGAIAQSILSQQPVVIADAQDFAAWWERGIPEAMQIRAWLIAPMIVQAKFCGLILLGKYEPSGYTQKDASSAFALARQGAIALETTRLQAQTQINLQMLQQRARRMASSSRITSVITSSLDRDEIFRTTAQLLIELFDADHCTIVMAVEQESDASLVAEYPETGSVGQRIRLTDNATMDWLTRYGTAVTIKDLESESDPTRDSLREMGAQSSMIAPLIIRDRVIGTISIDQMTRQRQFTSEECEMLVTIAGQVAIAVSHANLYGEALAVNRLRSAFLANISHELRTPLNAIIGYSDMLLSEFYGALNEQQQDRLARVNTSGKHLLTLIDDVLDLSKLEAGQITLALNSVRASDVLQAVLTIIAPAAQEKGLALTVNVSEDEPLIRADTRYLQQVLNNLLKNAVKFTPSGSVTLEVIPVTFAYGRSKQITVPKRLYVPEGDWLAVRVIDTGIGIKPEHQQMIFESFRQVDSSTIREYGGTGLGLAIAMKLVELHQGYLWVESALGFGSTFTVLLPTIDPNMIDDLDVATIQRDARPLVLVIEDDPTDRQLVLDYLGEAEYQVVCTANSMAALDIVRQLQPNVVITDVMMPEATGWDVLRDLKGDPTTAIIPVIVLSIIDQKTMGYGLGAADYLVKPVDRETLRVQVQRAVAGNATSADGAL